MCSYRETNSAFEASIICSGCGRSQGLAQDLDISMSTVEDVDSRSCYQGLPQVDGPG